MSVKQSVNKYTFEEALARIDQIVNTLEKGTATLDESLILYEEGTRLSQRCKVMLNEAKNKITYVNENNTND